MKHSEDYVDYENGSVQAPVTMASVTTICSCIDDTTPEVTLLPAVIDGIIVSIDYC